MANEGVSVREGARDIIRHTSHSFSRLQNYGPCTGVYPTCNSFGAQRSKAKNFKNQMSNHLIWYINQQPWTSRRRPTKLWAHATVTCESR